MPPDARLIADVAKIVARLMVAVEEGEPLPILGEVACLINLLIEHRNAPDARPQRFVQDEALRRAVAALTRS